MKKKGLFISFEGGEGAGKTTQAKLLADRLRSETGREVILQRSPGSTIVGEKIRVILKEKDARENLLPETELLLFCACHAQMTEFLIKPVLERGAILIADRFADSTLVYQGYARGLSKSFIGNLDSFACRGVKPDLTLLLDLSPEAGIQRASKRASDTMTVPADRFDSETMDFHAKIRNGFLDIAVRETERIKVINAGLSCEQVHNQIWEQVYEKLAGF